MAIACSPDPIQHAAVLGPVKAKPFGWPRRKTRPALTGPARGGSEIWRSGRKNARGAGRTKEWTQRSEGRMCAEQVELPRIVVVTCGRGGLVVTAYLGEVGRLESQGDLHQRVRDVGGGFIGDGVFRQLGWALARHRGRSGLTRQSRPWCGSSCLR